MLNQWWYSKKTYRTFNKPKNDRIGKSVEKEKNDFESVSNPKVLLIQSRVKDGRVLWKKNQRAKTGTKKNNTGWLIPCQIRNQITKSFPFPLTWFGKDGNVFLVFFCLKLGINIRNTVSISTDFFVLKDCKNIKTWIKTLFSEEKFRKCSKWAWQK